jgi:hypothetical protein
MYLKIVLVIIMLTATLQAKGGGKSAKGQTISKSVKAIKGFMNSSKDNSRKIINSNIPKDRSGIYNFKASDEKNYTGLSGKGKQGVRERLKQHLNSGKLSPNDINSVKWAKVNKKDLEKLESNEIKLRDFRSKGDLSNKNHAPMSRVRQKTENELKILKTNFK